MSATTTDLFARPAHNPSIFEVSTKAPPDCELLDFCVPVNLHYPHESLLDEIAQNLPDIVKYYPDYANVHQDHIGRMIDIAPEAIVVANGSTEIITELVRTATGPILTCAPTFGQWTDLPEVHGKSVELLMRHRENGFRLTPERVVERIRTVGAGMLVLSNPNNPTGVGMPLSEIHEIAERLPDLDRIVIDESFIDFSDLESAGPLATASPNLVVVKSMGKTLGWHGLRLGYAVAGASIAHDLRRALPYWNINGLAAFVLARIADRPGELANSLAATARDRAAMIDAMGRVEGLTVFPSVANFLLAELAPGLSGVTLRKRLLARHGIFIRECGNKVGSSSRYLRLAVARPNEVKQLVEALKTEMTSMQKRTNEP